MEAGVRVSAVVRFPSTTARVGSWEEGTVRRDKPCLTLLPVPEPAPASTCSFSTSQIGMAMAAIPRNPSTAHGAESATTLNQGRILARPYSSRLLGSQPVCLRKVLNSDPSRSQGRPPPQITTLETDLQHPSPTLPCWGDTAARSKGSQSLPVSRDPMSGCPSVSSSLTDTSKLLLHPSRKQCRSLPFPPTVKDPTKAPSFE